MSEIDQIQKDIDTLSEAIRFQWVELATVLHGPEEMIEAHETIAALTADLKDLIHKRDALRTGQKEALGGS